MDTDNNKPSILRYLIISVFIYGASVVLSVFTRWVLSVDNRFFVLCDSQINAVAAMVQGVVVAIAAGFTLYQLKAGYNYEKKKSDIEEARFILDYNRTLIESNAVYEVEHNLERWMDGVDEKRKKNPNIMPLKLKEDIPLEISDMNCRNYINYLVYFEGLAALIINDVLHLETIDDLFAYNFYLAMNNPRLQDAEIKKYPEYYRGCLKAYKIWTEYKRSNNHHILLEDFSIDKWEQFPYYSSRDITIRGLLVSPQNEKSYISRLSRMIFTPSIFRKELFQKQDNLKDVAKLIYDSDDYIYPATFGNKNKAKKLLPTIIKKADGLFSFKNIRVAIDENKKKIVGVVVATDKAFSIDIDDNIKNKLPKTFQDVYKHYFEELPRQYDGSGDAVYIACICVNKHYRGHEIGKMLLLQIIKKYEEKDIYLEVLTNNKPAIGLYEKVGFKKKSEQDGYPGVKTYTMKREKSI